VIRRYADGSVRYEGKNAEAERLAVRALMAERHDRAERLHAENMRLLGEAVEPTGTREVVHVVGDETDEALWRAWQARARVAPLTSQTHARGLKGGALTGTTSHAA
jgi:hypothetical protein